MIQRLDGSDGHAIRFDWLGMGITTDYQLRTFAAFSFGFLEGFLTI
jgi:hypothetical protein